MNITLYNVTREIHIFMALFKGISIVGFTERPFSFFPRLLEGKSKFYGTSRQTKKIASANKPAGKSLIKRVTTSKSYEFPTNRSVPRLSLGRSNDQSSILSTVSHR